MTMTWRTCALAALLAMGTTACADLDLGDTCLEIQLDYAGPERGKVYVKHFSRNESSSGLVSFPNVALAVGDRGHDERGARMSCWPGFPRDELIVLTAWIDRSGDERIPCRSGDDSPPAPPPYLRPDCAPDPDDPAGSLIALVKAKRHNLFVIQLEDHR
jgi:hypothetical protein